MKKRIFCIIVSLIPVIITGCREEGRIDHIDTSAPAPAQVTNVTVRNTPGGAVLKYTVPEDRNMLYVQAVYDIRPGVQREMKSSYYKDSLILEGFGDTGTYDVSLFSVGKNEKASDPLKVQVNPSTAPIRLAQKQLSETFGGVSVRIDNPEKANLVVTLMGDTAQLGYHLTLQSFYTSAEKAKFNFRGLDTIPLNFSVYLRDRWNNVSDTVTATVTPIFEDEIAMNTWVEYTLPGDARPYDGNYSVRGLWYGNFTNPQTNTYLSAMLPLPQIITWDFGKTVLLSRFKLWPRNHVDDRWRRGHPRIFEIWGSMNPNPDGSLDDTWIPLGRFESEKPSPGETITQEDIDYALAGFDYDFEESDFAPDPFVPVRYIRVRCIRTYNNSEASYVAYQQIRFWGTNVN